MSTLATGLAVAATAAADPSEREAALPVAPDATHFMWQGAQTSFVDGEGRACTAHVAVGVGDQAVCYAGSQGKLFCAGKIYTNVFGPAFTEVPGVEDVDQILVSSTVNSSEHNGICVKTRQGRAYCMGDYNDWGQYGSGATGATATWTNFGDLDDIVALATGTWDQMCAVTRHDGVFCAGYEFGPTPVSVASSAEGFYVDTSGDAQVNDPNVFRVANGRSDELVEPTGAVFDYPPPPILTFGHPGDVVDVVGTPLYIPPKGGFPSSRACWLDGAGAAWCAVTSAFPPPRPGSPPPAATQVFAEQNVLVLAGTGYSSSLCAVYGDGSIACEGDNSVGQLGLPPSSYVAAGTIVQPPGTIPLHCR